MKVVLRGNEMPRKNSKKNPKQFLNFLAFEEPLGVGNVAQFLKTSGSRAAVRGGPEKEVLDTGLLRQSQTGFSFQGKKTRGRVERTETQRKRSRGETQKGRLGLVEKRGLKNGIARRGLQSGFRQFALGNCDTRSSKSASAACLHQSRVGRRDTGLLLKNVEENRVRSRSKRLGGKERGQTNLLSQKTVLIYPNRLRNVLDREITRTGNGVCLFQLLVSESLFHLKEGHIVFYSNVVGSSLRFIHALNLT
mmetsp:Transcript_40361/g.84007  ORF Transcript_40361/g.84007 Transcript_40361/m.84007 type:complete len:250 (+) Transcript_40361:330-1079(+)